jgi:hypothetical protein
MVKAPMCWGELEPGDVISWNIPTSQGSRLTLVVVNRHDSDLFMSEISGRRLSSIIEFLDMESGKVRRHDHDNSAFLRDMYIDVMEQHHA